MLSEAEIRATLDESGRLDGLPYMPEMAAFCGRVCRVFRRANLICVEGHAGLRQMKDAVVLEDARCDGTAHGGCHRGCVILWKEQWLRKLTRSEARGLQRCQPPDVAATDVTPAPSRGPVTCAGPGGNVYSCQSTQLAEATSSCHRGERLQRLESALNGNITLRELCLIVGSALSRRVRRVLRGAGPRPEGARTKSTPRVTLDLKPGEIVEVRSREEILATLDDRNRNRGLTFEDSMLEMCGSRFRVQSRVDRIILETTGEMKSIRDTVVLVGANCGWCPRANRFYWREAWLKRV